MEPSDLRKRGYYIDNDYLVTPTGRFAISSYTGAHAVNKTMHILLKFLIFIVLLNIATFLVLGGATMPAGFGILYLSMCWLNSCRFDVIGLTAQGSHLIAEVKTPFYRFQSNEDDIANGIVSLILDSKK